MANILGLKGFSRSTGEKLLLAAFDNDIVNIGTGLGYGINLTSTNNVNFEVFLDSLFFQNYIDTPRSFDGTTWTRAHTSKLPLAKYIYSWNNRIYLAYLKIGTQEFPSSIWWSELPNNNTIQWGYERGTNMSTIAGNTLVTSANAGFKSYRIERGNHLFIIDGADAGEYIVETVASDQHLVLTEAMKATASNLTYWVGGNRIDVRRDDNDFITGITENNDQLIIFKQDTLHRFDNFTTRRIKGAFGTTSPKSIVNLGGLTVYFHGSFGTQTGFYAYDGTESIKISSSIENHIAGISTGKYTTIAAWSEGELYRAFVGDLSNTNYDISLSKVVLTYNVNTQRWSIDPIADNITTATTFRQAGTENIYLGTDNSQILITPSGNSFNSVDIPWVNNTNFYYPSGTDYLNTIKRVNIYSTNAEGLRVLYKLKYTPYATDQQWKGLGEISDGKTVIELPTSHNQASGIAFKFQGTDQQEATAIIEKMSILYRKEDVRI